MLYTDDDYFQKKISLNPKNPKVKYSKVNVYNAFTASELTSGLINRGAAIWATTAPGVEASKTAVNIETVCVVTQNGFIIQYFAEMPEADATMWLLKYGNQVADGGVFDMF